MAVNLNENKLRQADVDRILESLTVATDIEQLKGPIQTLLEISVGQAKADQLINTKINSVSS